VIAGRGGHLIAAHMTSSVSFSAASYIEITVMALLCLRRVSAVGTKPPVM